MRAARLAGLLLLTLVAGWAHAVGGGEGDVRRPRPVVLAHYMPWYAAPPTSEGWGWHWTMGRFTPGDGANPGVAAHDPPLIGPYDSGDPHLIEYHVSLMRVAGIDGVAIDWYGTSGFRDYAMVHRNTIAMMTAAEQAGLRVAVCYEDQTVGHRVDAGDLGAGDAVGAGAADLTWLCAEAFPRPAYVRLGGRPVLLVFGPQRFGAADWQALRARVAPCDPLLLGLPHLAGPAGFDGVMAWPPVHGGREIPREEWSTYLDGIEGGAARGSVPVATVAFPGFHDVYEQAGVQASHGFIDAREGRTLEETLGRALASGAPLVQIATWNDFGEGTQVEPTRDGGYRNLEIVQRLLLGPDAPADALRLPARILALRSTAPPGAAPLLDHATRALRSGDVRTAEALVRQASGMTTTAPPREHPTAVPNR